MIRLCTFSDEAASDIDGQIAALRRNGIGYTELRGISGKNVKDFTAEEAGRYAEILSDGGIKVWSIGSPLGKIDVSAADELYFDEVKRVSELCGVFGCDKVRVFSFYNAYGEKNKVFDYLSRMAEIAKDCGVSLCHENEKEVYGDTVARVLELKRNVPNLKTVYDPANFVQVGENAGVALKALAGDAEYFHIKDVIADTGELVPAGYGDCLIEKLVGGIQGDKVLTLEPHLAVFDGYAAIDGTEMKNKFRFADNGEAFDAAVRALKEILSRCGYSERVGGFTKGD